MAMKLTVLKKLPDSQTVKVKNYVDPLRLKLNVTECCIKEPSVKPMVPFCFDKGHNPQARTSMSQISIKTC